MVLLYVCYCTLMYFNPRLGNFCVKKVEEWQAKRRKGDKQPLLTEEQPLTPPKRGKSYGGPSTGIEEYGIPGKCLVCLDLFHQHAQGFHPWQRVFPDIQSGSQGVWNLPS